MRFRHDPAKVVLGRRGVRPSERWPAGVAIAQRRSDSRLAQPALEVVKIEANIVAKTVVGNPSGAGLRQQPGVGDAESLPGGFRVDQPEGARLAMYAKGAAQALGEPQVGAPGATLWDARKGVHRSLQSLFVV
jgi:hypothetical protein